MPAQGVENNLARLRKIMALVTKLIEEFGSDIKAAEADNIVLTHKQARLICVAIDHIYRELVGCGQPISSLSQDAIQAVANLDSTVYPTHMMRWIALINPERLSFKEDR